VRLKLLLPAVLAMAVALGYAGSRSANLMILLTALLVLGFLGLAGSWYAPLLVIPAAYLGQRVAFAGIDISISDAIVVFGAIAPFTYLDWRRHRELRTVLWAVAGFQACLVLSVLPAFNQATIQEWLHRAAIVAGSLVVGAYLAQNGKAKLAIQTFLGLSVVVSAVAVLDFLRTRQYAEPLGLQKNYSGSLLSSALLVSVLFTPTTARDRRILWGARVVMVLGLLAVESRGALLALSVGLLLWSFLSKQSRRLTIPLLLAVCTAAFFSIQEEQILNPEYGAVPTRTLNWQEATTSWLQSPLIGNGLRFYQADPTADLQGDPHNIVLLTLAESGIIGLGGFLLMIGTALVVAKRFDSRLGQVAVALIAARFTHGLVDVYWVHGSQAVPWVITGLLLGGASIEFAVRGRAGLPEVSEAMPAAQVVAAPRVSALT
jgi:O-antigen ligase